MEYPRHGMAAMPRQALNAYRGTFRFSGRSTRTESGALAVFASLGALLIVETARLTLPAGTDAGNMVLQTLALSAIQYLLFLPFAPLLARRLHDIGLPGWPGPPIFLGLLALTIWKDWQSRMGAPEQFPAAAEAIRSALVILFFVLLLLPPARGDNGYGPDPRTP